MQCLQKYELKYTSEHSYNMLIAFYHTVVRSKESVMIKQASI